MSEELFYTSVPRGLRPGTSGFCTVAATATLGPAWIQRLESLSGYKPLFPVGDARESENPVSFAHTRVSVAGQTRSVLTRSCSSGFDHTGRSNKFSYHLVLGEQDRNPGGPAWMMRQPPTLRTAWDGGEPRSIPSGRTLPTQRPTPGPANMWKQVTGDAAWAARLAEIAAQDPAAIVYVIYPLGTDVLTLFDESLRLLPETQRWQVTFNTYLTEQPVGGSTCAWRGIVAGSPAAAMARGNVLDLAALETAPSGPLAEAARTGQDATSVSIRSEQATEEGNEPTYRPTRATPRAGKASVTTIPLQGGNPIRPRQAMVPDNVNLGGEEKKSSATFVLAIVLPLVGIVCVGTVVAVMLMTKHSSAPTQANAVPSTQPHIKATTIETVQTDHKETPLASIPSKVNGDTNLVPSAPPPQGDPTTQPTADIFQTPNRPPSSSTSQSPATHDVAIANAVVNRAPITPVSDPTTKPHKSLDAPAAANTGKTPNSVVASPSAASHKQIRNEESRETKPETATTHTSTTLPTDMDRLQDEPLTIATLHLPAADLYSWNLSATAHLKLEGVQKLRFGKLTANGPNWSEHNKEPFSNQCDLPYRSLGFQKVAISADDQKPQIHFSIDEHGLVTCNGLQVLNQFKTKLQLLDPKNRGEAVLQFATKIAKYETLLGSVRLTIINEANAQVCVLKICFRDESKRSPE